MTDCLKQKGIDLLLFSSKLSFHCSSAKIDLDLSDQGLDLLFSPGHHIKLC